MRHPLKYRLARPWLLSYRALHRLRGLYSPGAFRILLFHDVPRDQFQAFERLLQLLLDTHGILSPKQVERILSGHGQKPAVGRVPFLLTFDDGFASNAAIARELLDRYDVQALFFVCPGLIDASQGQRRELAERYELDVQVPSWIVREDYALMSWPDLEALVEMGHTVGSHTLHHLRLSHLDDEDKRTEINESAENLEERLKVKIQWFAHPVGDLDSMDARSYHLIAQRYRFSCSGLRGWNSETSHPLGLLREHVDLTSPFSYQALILEGGLDFRYRRRVKRMQERLPDIKADKPVA